MRTYEIYVCDPEKNTECSKTLCQEFCKATAFAGFAKRDENGAPIIAEESDRVPQIKINREVFEKCEEKTETITVSKGCLKARTGRFVVYDVEYLKNHIEQEAVIYGNISAIEALKKSSWVPITYREMTEEEKNEFTVEETKILNCPLPDDGAEVLITTEFRNVFMDVFHNENGDCYFEDYEIEDARAWMPLPKPYKREAEA